MYVHGVSPENIFEKLPLLISMFRSANNVYFNTARDSILEAERDQGHAIQLKFDFNHYDYSTREEDVLILNNDFSMGNYKVFVIGEIRIKQDTKPLERMDVMRMLNPMGAYIVPETLGKD
jgi:hypothetical protein